MSLTRRSKRSALWAASCLITAASARATTYISGTSLDGVTNNHLAADRTPALYTGDFGDCLGGQSLLNVTKFDAAFYYDNSTILFHLDGTTNLKSESLMLYISVGAYGTTRFTMAFDPCYVNIYSLCPMNASVPITAFALFPVGQMQMSGIPQIAYEIPDFEGYARIQLFSNSSQTEIGCFQAVMRNGATFSQPKAMGSVLGVFTAVAVVASFATAAYGVSIPHMRMHYAHSFSVLIIFETFQSIFFSGSLSLNWPSVLSAWWSNFAWTAGFIPIKGMIQSIDGFAGVSGNASQVGGAGSTIINNNGGGLAQQIYGRSLASELVGVFERRAPKAIDYGTTIMGRQAHNDSDPYDYDWNGNPVTPGMPIPADWSGFAGTLSELGIPASDAFMISFIWLLVILACVTLLLVVFKLALEGLARLKWIKQDRLDYFRSHWRGYISVSLLRVLFIAFSAMCIMTMFQFSHAGKTGPLVIAAIVFAVFTLGLGGLAAYALRSRLRLGKFAVEPDRILLHRGVIMGCIPFLVPIRLSQLGEQEFARRPAASVPFIRCHFVDDQPDRPKVHNDVDYIKRFGWLYARYRLSRWWYFIFWLAYQFVRACFIGGATTNPLAQIFGLFIVDILSLVAIAAINPYEGQRNTATAVWLLGISKLVTTGLSVAFLPDFNLDRIVTTVIGVVIIVVQALITIAILILIVLGGISSWMSLTRNREDFSSQRLEGVRIKYFEHIAIKALDKRAPPAERRRSMISASDPDEKAVPARPKEPRFAVTSVRRISKIEDEDDDYLEEIEPPLHHANPSAPTAHPATRMRRTNSVSSRHSVSSLPRAARPHRASWSSRDFSSWQAQTERANTALVRRLSTGQTRDQPRTSISGAPRSKASITSLRGPTSRRMTPAQEVAEEADAPGEKLKEENALDNHTFSGERADQKQVYGHSVANTSSSSEYTTV
ncbi:hypothetical protein BKA67DRAFT_525735 [Truncatella angustata]|uniref:ML-like domain-containing protein n=1 Tax=Truncatella angustata TaxID=152316 RepID=A0A9P8RMQ0_9PEZI|nr:uncharacterized protein BKA67DRAFT_525735 [Truncatella angustata]KAH6646060.1 hypothetical protein BKA67DRAFT_525735 [Truncatella angustata]